MPRTEEANEQIRRGSTARILAAARAVYARKGGNVTIAEIAAEAGVSQGLPYRYFRTKYALFDALFGNLLESQTVLASRTQALGSTPGQRFERMVTNMIELRRTSPELFRLLQESGRGSKMPAKLRRELAEHGRSIRTLLRRLITEGQASGEIAGGDPDQLVIALLACLDGLGRVGQWPSPPSGRVTFPDAAIVLRMFRPAEARP